MGYAANSNQLQSVTQDTSVRDISYTVNGNTQHDQFGTGQVFTYTYNEDNRLTQAALGGVPQARYTQLPRPARDQDAGTAATHFHYDRGGHLIAESDGSGNVQREYVFLDDTPIAFITPSGTDFIHPNHLGTPQKMTDANQNIVWDGGCSDPFMMSPLPTTPAMGLRLPGQYYDSKPASTTTTSATTSRASEGTLRATGTSRGYKYVCLCGRKSPTSSPISRLDDLEPGKCPSERKRLLPGE